LVAIAMTACPSLAQSPVYHQSFTDHVWSPVGGGAFRAEVVAEDYANELWERPVEDAKWVESGGYRTTTGKYYAYGDLSAAALGYDNQYLYLSFTTVGSFVQNVGEGPIDSGLKAQYYMYFGVGDDPDKRYLVNLGNGSSVNAGGFTQIGKLYHDANQDLFGSGLLHTYDSTGGLEKDLSDGFESEIGSALVYSRSNGLNTIEMALDLASAGLNQSQVANLGFLYFAAATSNPSGPGDLFAHDEFREAPGQGQEYDTLGAITILSVPEPSSSMLSAAAVVLLLAKRRRKVRP
jgi:hypothetical protein